MDTVLPLHKIDAPTVLRAAYSATPDEAAWLTGVLEALHLSARVVFGYSYDARIGMPVQLGVGAQAGEMPPSEFWRPTVDEWVRRAPASALHMLYRSKEPVVWFRRLFTRRGLHGEELSDLMQRTPFEDITAVACWDPTGYGVLLGLPGVTAKSASRHSLSALRKVAAHVAAARRLRAHVRSPDFVFTPKGRLEHVVYDANKSILTALVDAVQQREHVRNGRAESEQQALELWRAMNLGRWTLIDQVDRDGKRYVLARKNTVDGPDVTTLSESERQIVAFVSMGHANKYIAYELGIAPSTVARTLTRAMRKLGVSSRRELILRT